MFRRANLFLWDPLSHNNNQGSGTDGARITPRNKRERNNTGAVAADPFASGDNVGSGAGIAERMEVRKEEAAERKRGEE